MKDPPRIKHKSSVGEGNETGGSYTTTISVVPEAEMPEPVQARDIDPKTNNSGYFWYKDEY